MQLKTAWQKEIYENPQLLGKIIAIQNEKIVFIANTYKEVIAHFDQQNQSYSLFKVPKNCYHLRILSFRIKSLKKHPWLPTYPIKFYFDNHTTQIKEMLVDSGADISLINYEFGRLLGFEKSPHEAILEAEGIGGCTIPYLLRNTLIEIAGFQFENLFAWLQDEQVDEMIIGREMVLDLFDIEFKQAEETIIFKPRKKQ
jgi:hypothetical protein